MCGPVCLCLFIYRCLCVAPFMCLFVALLLPLSLTSPLPHEPHVVAKFCLAPAAPLICTTHIYYSQVITMITIPAVTLAANLPTHCLPTRRSYPLPSNPNAHLYHGNDNNNPNHTHTHTHTQNNQQYHNTMAWAEDRNTGLTASREEQHDKPTNKQTKEKGKKEQGKE
ncbi:hypothetical protein T492DRAFT_1110542 [Pavlovales sp. CCMP2436]|nr:hypothetical protein T492DRAFT_1110542 [Pavlovales sp. CCMP2436]